MKLTLLKNKRFWKWFLLSTVFLPVILFSIAIGIVYAKQDLIVQEMLKTVNADFVGTLKIRDSHIAPFANLPYVSVDLEDLEIFEGKDSTGKNRIAHVDHAYIGFSLLDMLSGNVEIKTIKLSKGELRIVQHKDGSFNLTNALSSKKPLSEVKEEMHLDLKSIKLDEFKLSKLNESNNVMVDTYIQNAISKFKTQEDHLFIALKSRFKLSLIKDGDTTFLKNKNFNIDTEIDLNKKRQILTFSPTEIELEEAAFGFDGDIDLKNDMDLDLHFHGNKPDFNLLVAMAPQELTSTLEKFENRGKLFFEASVKGKSINGNQPAINARFSCDEGLFNNTESGKKLENIGFKGSFTNGKRRNASTMRFVLENFTAKPEAGRFNGKLTVENFDSPEIDMKLNSDFDLDFLAKFLGTKELSGLSGRVILKMNFHDIIDIDQPEKSIEKLNESYYTELLVKDLTFKSADLPVPLNDLDLKVTLKGHQAVIQYMNMKMGSSDVNLSGTISDLPAIIHHTDIPVSTKLNIRSKLIDLKELSAKKGRDGIDEQIENLRLDLKFNSSAKAITESPNLPIGEFFIDNLYAKLKHYPHTIQNFHADVFIDHHDFRVIDFSGMIDRSDFHFSGKLANYNLWFEEKLHGDTKIDFDLSSRQLNLNNLFTYNGERFVPEEYRHEEIKNLKLHGSVALHFNHGLQSTDLKLTQFEGSMKVHPLPFENFNGSFHYEKGHLSVKDFNGKLGHSRFNVDLEYTLDPKLSAKPNMIRLSGPNLDIDELMNYNSKPSSANSSAKKVDHDAGFSLYDFEFPDMKIDVNLERLNYHHHLMNQVKAEIKLTKNHMVYLTQFGFDAAGGHFDIKGYLSGKDKKHIYFSPDVHIRNVDLDKFLVKFENFGQDHLVSENLHGKFTGHITGKIHLHADLVPKLDDSEIKLEMSVINGRLENYAPLQALSEFFEDKNVNKVHFDTLKNTFTVKNSVFKIPSMTINSSLGFMEIKGEQRLDGKMEMDYLIGVPWKMITKIGGQKLFGKKNAEKENDDEIIYRQKNSKFLYVRMTGDLENYNVKLAKKPK
jgi:DNA replication protein DnaD